MNKKVLATLLVMGMCISNLGVLAAEKTNKVTSTKKATVETTQISEVATEVEGEVTTEPEVTPAPTTEPEVTPAPTTEPEVTPAPTTEPEVTPAPTTEPTKEEKEIKSKIVKEDLTAKKQERADAKVETKEYISGVKELFKDADVATRKEILAEIATAKKELKDYSIGTFVKGLAVDFDKYDGVEPVIEEGRTLVPVRAITETLGATVEWVEETNTIIITKDEIVIKMQLDNKIAYVNDQEVELEVAPTTKKDRTIVPIRFISETFNLTVDWDDDSQTVIVE